MEGTWVLERVLASTARNLVLEGGARASKTYSVMQSFAVRLFNPAERGLRIDVFRKTMPALRASAMRDFFEILYKYDLYRDDWHNKTDNIYRVPYYDTEIAFLGLDQPQKIRSRGRDIGFANEGNELTEEDYLQLRLRTTRQLILDYNPSDQFHWIYERVLPRDDTERIHATYRDNPYLPESLVREIEALEEEDAEAWKVYGLGLRGSSEATIYPVIHLCDDLPAEENDPVYGLDVGFTNQSALVEIDVRESREGRDELYIDELLYERRLTDADLVERFEELDIDKDLPMYVDSAAASTIQYLVDHGYNALPSDKDVQAGIRAVKSYIIHVTKRSANLQKELRSYRRKVDKDGHVLEDPVKFNDHLADSTRYALFTHFGPSGGVDSWLVE